MKIHIRRIIFNISNYINDNILADACRQSWCRQIHLVVSFRVSLNADYYQNIFTCFIFYKGQNIQCTKSRRILVFGPSLWRMCMHILLNNLKIKSLTIEASYVTYSQNQYDGCQMIATLSLSNEANYVEFFWIVFIDFT